MRLLLLLLALVAACSFDATAQPAPKLRVVQLVAPGKTIGDFGRSLGGMTVTVQDIGKLSVAKDLAPHDVVVLSDVPMHLIGNAQVAALETYVKGGGLLLAAGGETSFGTGAYQATRLEQLLPVRFDSERTKSTPDIATIIVVDTSDAMKGKPIEQLIPALEQLAAGLWPNDIVAVVGFAADAKAVVRPQRAANRQRIADELKRIATGGATSNLYAGLRESYEMLEGISARKKHVIVVGNAPVAEAGIADLVDDMRASRITLSAFALPKAPRELFAKIAKAGDGTLYPITDPAALGKQLAIERIAIQKALTSDKVHVVIAKRIPAIDTSGVEKAPPLRGYVTTKPRPTAEVLLISDEGEPLLARWCYGAGTVVTWTADLDGAWSSEWTRWSGYSPFWTQVVRGIRMNCATK